MSKKRTIYLINTESGGKTIAQIRNLVRLIKRLDGSDKRNLSIAENYNKYLQELSGESIGVRIWVDWDNALKCVVVYPNTAVKELIEH